MNNATMIEPATASPVPTGTLTGKDGPETGEPSMELPTTPQEAYAVQLTEEEWHEQDKLAEEHVEAIIRRDRKKADEVLPRIIFPSYLLKATKKLLGADYIRKKGYNTADADLVYGPDWLDEDDGGPVSIYAEELSR